MGSPAIQAPRLGLEPRTYRLTAGRSTIELSGKETGLILTHDLVKALLQIATFVSPPGETQSNHPWSFVRSERGKRSAQNPLSDRRWLGEVVSGGLVNASKCGAISSSSPTLVGLVRESCRNRAGPPIDVIRRDNTVVLSPAPTAG